MTFHPDPKPEPRPKNKRGHIRPVATKKASDKTKYNSESKEWLRGKMCGCDCGNIATTVHHKRGREGYADSEKYILGIKLLNDQDYWLPACMPCHIEIEASPTFAYENGYSESRKKNIYR